MSSKTLCTKPNQIMCIIIIKKKDKQVKEETIKTAARINPHGLGIVWLDTFEITYHESKEYKVLITDRPYIAHFRYATVGEIGKSNTHPFQCGKRENEWLMMNGTIPNIGNVKECDSKVLAKQLGDVPRERWSDELGKHSCRFVTVNTRNRTYQLYNKDLWTRREGVWYSKSNVFEKNYVAVYGTLKKGHGNHDWYMSDSKFVGKGKTKDLYPLLIQGLPYLIDKKGFGHNVNVEVYRVSDDVLASLDRLEGHPSWYKRKRVPILVGESTINCWVYFNGSDLPKNAQLFKSYTKSTKERAVNTSYQTKISYEDMMNYEYEEIEKRKKYESMCVNCYSSLKFDGFMDYHCSSCDEWFCESEVVKY